LEIFSLDPRSPSRDRLRLNSAQKKWGAIGEKRQGSIEVFLRIEGSGRGGLTRVASGGGQVLGFGGFAPSKKDGGDHSVECQKQLFIGAARGEGGHGGGRGCDVSGARESPFGLRKGSEMARREEVYDLTATRTS